MNLYERITLLYDNNHIQNLYDKLDDWKALRRLEKKYQRIQEYRCNGGVYLGIDFTHCNHDLPDNPISKLELKLETWIIALVKQINPDWSVKFRGDPRGYTVDVYSHLRSISHLLFG